MSKHLVTFVNAIQEMIYNLMKSLFAQNARVYLYMLNVRKELPEKHSITDICGFVSNVEKGES